MSVYTTVETEQLEKFLQRYVLGNFQSLRPIAAGITNTNYYLDTDAGQFVLTLYEHHSDDELDYILGLQLHLAERSLHCSAPVIDRRGEFYSILNQRPAAIIHRLPGDVVNTPGPEHCAAIGAELARFHLAGQDYPGVRANPRGLDWLIAARDMLDAEFSSADAQIIEATLHEYRRCDLSELPHGAIHADLFHDNTLFEGDTLGGIVDFDYACSDVFVFDLAVLLNDWAIDDRGELQAPLVAAVLTAYQQIRVLSKSEIETLPLLLRVAALRFWLSRLYDKAFPVSGELTTIKCPDEFRRLLESRATHSAELGDLLLPHYIG